MAQLYSLTETDGVAIKVDLLSVGNYIFTQQWDAGTTIGVVSLDLDPWNINPYGDTRVALRLLRDATEISRVILDCAAWNLGSQWIDFDFDDVVLNTKAAYSFQLISYGALSARWNCETGNPKTVGYTVGYDSQYDHMPIYQSDGWDCCLVVNGTTPAPQAPQKPTNPCPADGAVGADFSDRTLGWENGGGAETYDVYVGYAANNMGCYSHGQAGTSYTVPQQLILDPDSVWYWRVDAKAGEETTAGDTWSFDPRPAKTTNPTPANTAASVSIGLALLDWEAG